MKTVKSASLIFALLALMLSATTSYAYNGDDPKDISNLRDQVTKLVKGPEMTKYGVETQKVFLKFMLNHKNEIVVLSTGTNNAYLDAFIKGRLNYKRVKAGPLTEKFYNMHITFKAP